MLIKIGEKLPKSKFLTVIREFTIDFIKTVFVLSILKVEKATHFTKAKVVTTRTNKLVHKKNNTKCSFFKNKTSISLLE